MTVGARVLIGPDLSTIAALTTAPIGVASRASVAVSNRPENTSAVATSAPSMCTSANDPSGAVDAPAIVRCATPIIGSRTGGSTGSGSPSAPTKTPALAGLTSSPDRCTVAVICAPRTAGGTTTAKRPSPVVVFPEPIIVRPSYTTTAEPPSSAVAPLILRAPTAISESKTGAYDRPVPGRTVTERLVALRFSPSWVFSAVVRTNVPGVCGGTRARHRPLASTWVPPTDRPLTRTTMRVPSRSVEMPLMTTSPPRTGSSTLGVSVVPARLTVTCGPGGLSSFLGGFARAATRCRNNNAGTVADQSPLMSTVVVATSAPSTTTVISVPRPSEERPVTSVAPVSTVPRMTGTDPTTAGPCTTTSSDPALIRSPGGVTRATIRVSATAGLGRGIRNRASAPLIPDATSWLPTKMSTGVPGPCRA